MYPDFSFTSSSSSSRSSSSTCELSPHDRFLSTLITSFVGSIVTGIGSGWFIAFCTAWICWFATARIVVVGMWFCKQALWGANLEGAVPMLRKIPLFNRAPALQNAKHPYAKAGMDDGTAPPSYEEAVQLEQQTGSRQSDETTEPLTGSAKPDTKLARQFGGLQSGPPTILGWAGWIYAATYFPIVQVMWLAGNWSTGPSSGSLKLVRAIGIGVTALPLTMDTKARYAVALEKRFGKWANRLFTYIHAFSTLTLGLLAATMLVVSAIQMPAPVQLIIGYAIFSIIWMFGSFLLFPPVDGGMSPDSVGTFLAGLGMGIFGGVFTSAAAFGAMGSAATEPGMTLGNYLACENVAVWHKFIAIFP